MKKIILFLPLAIFLAFGFFYFKDTATQIVSLSDSVKSESIGVKRPIMRVGLVADSHNDNELLKKAFLQIKGVGVNFVIGLGDWSNVGTGEELLAAKKVFDDSKLKTYLLPGDHDLWDSRNRGEEALLNYGEIFGQVPQTFEQNDVQFIMVDNSDIYLGISQEDWKSLEEALDKSSQLIVNSSQTEQERDSAVTVNRQPTTDNRLTFVFAHKTPFHPDSSHVMGEDSPEVAKQAENFMNLMEAKKADGFFSGDLHFFAKFKSPDASVKITTIGAVDVDRNFQGPRFGVLTIFEDYSWEVEDVEIR